MGRKKIEMKLVKDDNSKQVTFSKRRNGIFKKGHELATLCAVQILLIIFSPGGRPYSFASPAVESVMQKFFDLVEEKTDEDDEEADEDDEQMEDPQEPCSDIIDMNKKFDDLFEKLKIEKERGDTIKAANKEKRSLFSVPTKNKKQSHEQLLTMDKMYKEFLEDLKDQYEMLDAASSLLKLAEKPVLASDLPENK